MRSGNWFSQRITSLLKDNAIDGLYLIVSNIKAIIIVVFPWITIRVPLVFQMYDCIINPNKDPICKYICK